MGRALKIQAWARPGLEPYHEFWARAGSLPPRSLYAGQHNILFQQHYPRLCTFSRSSYQRISKCNMNLLIHLLNELKPNEFQNNFCKEVIFDRVKAQISVYNCQVHTYYDICVTVAIYNFYIPRSQIKNKQKPVTC